MEFSEVFLILARMSFGAIATFLAILFWSRTRDTAWMLVIIAVIIQYGEIMYSTFTLFGVLADNIFIIPGILDVYSILKILPLVFYGAAFIVMLVRYRRGG